MIFSSISFLFCFLPFVLVCYYLVPKKYKNEVLLLSSLVFYGWGELHFVSLLIATIVLGWLFGILIEKMKDLETVNHHQKMHSIGEKVCLALPILMMIGMLAYFKYANFFIDNWNRIFQSQRPFLSIALPLGISFYSFQVMSYLIDVYRREVKAQHHLLVFATYVSMFPQLVAGPIVRYRDMEKQLLERSQSSHQLAIGLERFTIGLGKKVLLADALSELFEAYQTSKEPSVLFAWLAALAFMLQIYFDFSGYSDMAIGLGHMFGFTLMENFDYPYEARSITEFWRRWHISLGSWFRDYLYIPLGGNKKGLLRQMCNVVLVWLLTGLWHGASWNFVLWGMFFALFLIIEKLGFLRILEEHKLLSHVYTLLLILLGFVLFAHTSLEECIRTFATMFGFGGQPFLSIESVYYLKSYRLLLVIAAFDTSSLAGKLIKKCLDTRLLGRLFVALVWVLAVANILGGSFHPFLYFRF